MWTTLQGCREILPSSASTTQVGGVKDDDVLLRSPRASPATGAPEGDFFVIALIKIRVQFVSFNGASTTKRGPP